LCPASVTTFPKKNIRLDQYLKAKSLQGSSHHTKNLGDAGHYKDHEFDWFDTDGSEFDTVESNTTVSKQKKTLGDTVEFDVFLWHVSVHHNFGESPKDREFRESIESMEEELLGDDSYCGGSSSSSFLNYNSCDSSFASY
jgi:hypothetical protein